MTTLNDHLARWQARRQRRLAIERRLIAGCLAVTAACFLAVAVHAENGSNGPREGAKGTNSPSDATGGANAGWWSYFSTPRYGVFVPSNQNLCGGDCDSRTGGTPGYGGWSW
jgi:hypothetical protein